MVFGGWFVVYVYLGKIDKIRYRVNRIYLLASWHGMARKQQQIFFFKNTGTIQINHQIRVDLITNLYSKLHYIKKQNGTLSMSSYNLTSQNIRV